MRVVNGVAVIDNSSICINHIDTTNELPITLKENQDTPITSLSFKKNSNRSKKWKKDETDLFYQVLFIYLKSIIYIYQIYIYIYIYIFF